MKKNAGLCSVTFRNLTPREIVALAAGNGLACIEWGGDVHVPPDDLANAESVGRLTRESGLKTLSYGSYYKCRAGEDFGAVSRCAEALGAGTVRIWAGERSSKETSAQEYAALLERVRACARIAASRLQRVAFEYHGGTFTDTPESAMKLLRDAGEENVRLYWQPAYWFEAETEEARHKENLRAVRLLKNCVVGVHVYRWVNGYERRPLAEAKAEWARYLQETEADFYDLEFVKDDSVRQLECDAALIKELCGAE